MTPEDRESLAQQLIDHEGFRPVVYRCTSGKLTIGIGRNLESRGISIDEAMLLLGNDIDDCIGSLTSAFPWFASLDSVRQRALVDLRFNLGMGGLLTFKKMLSALAVKDFDTAAGELQRSMWANQVQPDRVRRIFIMLKEGKDR